MKKKSTFFILIVLLIFICQFSHAVEIFKKIENIRIFVIDDDENIYTNYGRNSIAKYSKEGEPLLKIGRVGEGPGDIKRLGWFAINPIDKKIYVTESFGGNRWISTFSQTGEYLGEWACELKMPEWNSLSYIEFDSEGNVYIEALKVTYRKYKNFSIGSHEYNVFKLSPKGKILKKIYSMATDFEADKGGKGNVTIPFHNYLYWTIYGKMIIIRESKADFISIYDTNGNLERKIKLPFPQKKVSDKDVENWYKNMRSIRWVKRAMAQGVLDLKFWKKNLPFPEYNRVSWYPMYVDGHGLLYSCHAGDEKSKWNTWAQINLSDFKISIVYSLTADRLIKIEGKNFFVGRKLEEEEELYVVKTNKNDFFKDRKTSTKKVPK